MKKFPYGEYYGVGFKRTPFLAFLSFPSEDVLVGYDTHISLANQVPHTWMRLV